MKSIVMIGAFLPEIELIVDQAPVTLPGSGEFVLERLECGIGNVAAALALQERLLNPPPDKPAPAEAIFIGSAGRYGPGPYGSADELHLGFGRRFHNREIAVLEGRAHLPEPMTSLVECEPGPAGLVLRDALSAAAGDVNSPDSLTLSSMASLSRDASEPFDCAFENMEAFGLAFAAKRHGLPFCALMALTNQVGPDGSREWREHHKGMGQTLQRGVMRVLGS